MPEEDALLEEIISKINERFDGIFSEGDRVIVETLYNRAKENKKLNRQAQKNADDIKAFLDLHEQDFYHNRLLTI